MEEGERIGREEENERRWAGEGGEEVVRREVEVQRGREWENDKRR